MIKLGVIKKLSSAKKYMRGTVMARENKGAELYILLRGEVGLYLNYGRQNQEIAATVGPGNIFGETALFLEKKEPSTAVALTDVFALPVNKNTVLEFIKDEPEMTFELMKELCARMDNIRTAYEELSGHPWAEPKVLKEEAPAAETENVQAEPVPPAPSPAAIESDIPQNSAFSLYPEGHGSYKLPLNNEDRVHLMEKSYTCPVCKKEFKALRIKTSKLILESTDSDMRNRYQGVEPLYYDVVTCPNCLYSALTEMFDNPDRPNAELKSELQPIKEEANILFGTAMDTHSLFAGYYLALFCAPKCFSSHYLATAKLLLKLSRIYSDCGDQQMEEETTKRALGAYLDVYQNVVQMSPNQDQQLCLIIGELHFKLKDFSKAKDFFFKAKSNRDGTPLLKGQAENRIMDIRVMEGRA